MLNLEQMMKKLIRKECNRLQPMIHMKDVGHDTGAGETEEEEPKQDHQVGAIHLSPESLFTVPSFLAIQIASLTFLLNQ